MSSHTKTSRNNKKDDKLSISSSDTSRTGLSLVSPGNLTTSASGLVNTGMEFNDPPLPTIVGSIMDPTGIHINLDADGDQDRNELYVNILKHPTDSEKLVLKIMHLQDRRSETLEFFHGLESFDDFLVSEVLISDGYQPSIIRYKKKALKNIRYQMIDRCLDIRIYPMFGVFEHHYGEAYRVTFPDLYKDKKNINKSNGGVLWIDSDSYRSTTVEVVKGFHPQEEMGIWYSELLLGADKNRLALTFNPKIEKGIPTFKKDGSGIKEKAEQGKKRRAELHLDYYSTGDGVGFSPITFPISHNYEDLNLTVNKMFSSPQGVAFDINSGEDNISRFIVRHKINRLSKDNRKKVKNVSEIDNIKQNSEHAVTITIYATDGKVERVIEKRATLLDGKFIKREVNPLRTKENMYKNTIENSVFHLAQQRSLLNHESMLVKGGEQLDRFLKIATKIKFPKGNKYYTKGYIAFSEDTYKKWSALSQSLGVILAKNSDDEQFDAYFKMTIDDVSEMAEELAECFVDEAWPGEAASTSRLRARHYEKIRPLEELPKEIRNGNWKRVRELYIEVQQVISTWVAERVKYAEGGKELAQSILGQQKTLSLLMEQRNKGRDLQPIRAVFYGKQGYLYQKGGRYADLNRVALPMSVYYFREDDQWKVLNLTTGTPFVDQEPYSIDGPSKQLISKLNGANNGMAPGYMHYDIPGYNRSDTVEFTNNFTWMDYLKFIGVALMVAGTTIALANTGGLGLLWISRLKNLSTLFMWGGSASISTGSAIHWTYSRYNEYATLDSQFADGLDVLTSLMPVVDTYMLLRWGKEVSKSSKVYLSFQALDTASGTINMLITTKSDLDAIFEKLKEAKQEESIGKYIDAFTMFAYLLAKNYISVVSIHDNVDNIKNGFGFGRVSDLPENIQSKINKQSSPKEKDGVGGKIENDKSSSVKKDNSKNAVENQKLDTASRLDKAEKYDAKQTWVLMQKEKELFEKVKHGYKLLEVAKVKVPEDLFYKVPYKFGVPEIKGVDFYPNLSSDNKKHLMKTVKKNHNKKRSYVTPIREGKGVVYGEVVNAEVFTSVSGKQGSMKGMNTYEIGLTFKGYDVVITKKGRKILYSYKKEIGFNGKPIWEYVPPSQRKNMKIKMRLIEKQSDMDFSNKPYVFKIVGYE